MLVAGVLKFDAQGRIIVSGAPPVTFNGGTPIAADGSLAAAIDVVPHVFIGGIGYTHRGRICNSSSPLIPPGGVLTNELGQLAVDTSPPVLSYAGLPITAAGRLSVSSVAPSTTGFDDGFSEGFGP